MRDIAIQALRTAMRLSLVYHQENRVVEVHAVGISTAGNEVMRVWQVRGGSTSGAVEGWKLMQLSDVEHPRLLDEPSTAPRAGYKPGDRGMTTIFAQL